MCCCMTVSGRVSWSGLRFVRCVKVKLPLHLFWLTISCSWCVPFHHGCYISCLSTIRSGKGQVTAELHITMSLSVSECRASHSDISKTVNTPPTCACMLTAELTLLCLLLLLFGMTCISCFHRNSLNGSSYAAK